SLARFSNPLRLLYSAKRNALIKRTHIPRFGCIISQAFSASNSSPFNHTATCLHSFLEYLSFKSTLDCSFAMPLLSAGLNIWAEFLDDLFIIVLGSII